MAWKEDVAKGRTRVDECGRRRSKLLKKRILTSEKVEKVDRYGGSV